MKSTVRNYIREHSLLQDSDPVVVGVSGGVDSMSLLHILYELGYDIFAVHFNHELRGRESDADVQCVSDYCAGLGISFLSVRLGNEIRKQSGSGSIQECARRLRYNHFRRIAVAKGIRHVAVAHNRNDQAETVLLNLKRGTGLDGMAAMRASRVLNYFDPFEAYQGEDPHDSGDRIHLIRPLLCVRRRQIESYVADRAIPWREDKSNQDLRYTRNRIRHEIIPEHARGIRPDFIDDIAEAAEAVARVVDEVIPESLPGPLRNWTHLDRRLPIESLMQLSTVLRSWLYLRALRRWLPAAPARSTTISAIDSLLRSQPGRRVQFKSGCIWRERTAIHFDRRPVAGVAKADPESILDSELDSRSIELVPGISVRVDDRYVDLEIKSLDGAQSVITERGEDCCRVFLDLKKVTGSLTVRRWRAGDRFVPLGMKGSKKVKSYLTDVKVESSLRSDVHVVCDDEKIVWLVGHRLDNRVRLDKDSRIVARLCVGSKIVDMTPVPVDKSRHP